ncbi:hypothetical protein [Acrocarpospora catenulata]|uniref:hypothetical protein n=1 Tax=Acrocarpospora catenulata TaxID=2836182 RepID=UPI001BD9FAFF|nr:hypothetical protein [Acrocarpospora catenulata]
MDEQNGGDDTRGWFVPPPSQPTDVDITYAGPLPSLRPPRRPVPPDVRVWPPPPPPEEDDEGYSTQPFPVIAAERRPLPRPAPPAVPSPPPATSPPPAAPEPPARARKPNRALRGAGAVLAVLLAVGIPSYVGYRAYLYGAGEPDIVHVVQPGATGEFRHVAWQASVALIPNPAGDAERPGRQWVKLTVTRTAQDAEGAIRHGAPAVELRDNAGRSWRTETLRDETPPDTTENRVGQPYRMELVAVVPTDVAETVEVHLRPSNYRSVPGQSVEDMLNESEQRNERDVDVLRFLR